MENVYEKVGLYHYSPSQLNKPLGVWMFNYCHLDKDQRRKIKVGWNAAFGTAVHGGLQGMLCSGVSLDEAIDSAQMSMDFHEAPASEPPEKLAKFRELIPEAIEQGIDLLAEPFGGSEEERRVEVSLAGVDLPVIGYIDLFKSDRFCEVKTKAARMGKVKSDGTRGWTKATLPARPEYSHVCQVAVYEHATGLKPNIAYVAAHGAILFSPDNCDELKPDYLAHCLEDMRSRAIRRQNLLHISTDPKVLAGLIDPDFEHPFYWDEEFKDEAKELWKS